MKRIGFLYAEICSIENLQLADAIAQKGKTKQPAVIDHNKEQDMNILKLHHLLVDRTFRTSEYTTFAIFEPKERIISRLPYYPDRIVHHAVMNILEPYFIKLFTADTYSCIKGRGIHKAAKNLKKILKDVSGTAYCLKLDIKKFYPCVDHQVLKELLGDKFKDPDLIWLLDEIIDSADGLPIGNYLSQYLANYYLSGFDHWIKENRAVKYYLRYADDMVIFSNSKTELHTLLADIKEYLNNRLKLTVKSNYQVFPVAARGIDFVGYVFYHTHTLLRKSIKQNFARMLKNRKNPASIASYKGWAKHADTKHLIKKLLNDTT